MFDIDPSAHDFTCVGYAASKGRRCGCAIAAANRREASKTLDHMSRLQPTSTRLEEMLESLAPRLLCKRFHQNQAATIVERWQGDLANFRATLPPAQDEPTTIETLSETLADLASTLNRQNANARESAIAALPSLARTLTGLLNAVESLRASVPESNPSAAAQEVHGEQEHESPDARTLPGQYPDSRDTTPGILEPDIQPEEDQAAFRPQASSHETNHRAGLVVEEGNEEDLEEDGIEQERHTWGRRLIEGHCTICLEGLDNGDDLVWCVAQCGQNFHEGCIDLWRAIDEYTQTCPICRADWVEF